MKNEMVGHDVYMRSRPKAKIQQCRVWDSNKFMQARVDEGLTNKDGPVEVTFHTEDEFKAERIKRNI